MMTAGVLVVLAVLLAALLTAVLGDSDAGDGDAADGASGDSAVAASRFDGQVEKVVLTTIPGRLTLTGTDGDEVVVVDSGADRPDRRRVVGVVDGGVLTLSWPCPVGTSCLGISRVEVPRAVAVELPEASGDVLLEGLGGPTAVRASSINLTATALRTPSLTVTLTSGSMRASFAEAPASAELNLASAHATLVLPSDVHYRVDSETTNGQLDVQLPHVERTEASQPSGDGAEDSGAGVSTVAVRISSGSAALLPAA